MGRRKKLGSGGAIGRRARKKKAEEIAVAKASGELPAHIPGRKYDDTVRQTARLLYISGAASMAVISKELDIPPGTLRSWHSIEKWARLRREVKRFSAKDSVRIARRAMGRYAKQIDDSLNNMLEVTETRLKATNLNEMDSEHALMRLQLEILKTKIGLLRSLTHGAYRKSLAPHPETTLFKGTEEPQQGTLMPRSDIEALLKTVPEHMKEAAKFVLGMDAKDLINADVIDAVASRLDREDGVEDPALMEGYTEDSDDEDDTLSEIDMLLSDDDEEF